MKNNPSKLIKRLSIIAPIKFLIGTLVFIFLNKIIGGAFLAGGVVTISFIVFLKHKHKTKINVEKTLAYFHIAFGIIMYSASILLHISEASTKEVLFKIIAGSVFTLIGIYTLIFKCK